MKSAVEAWRAANQRATEAERLVTQAYLDFFSGLGPEPPQGMQDTAKSLRAVANELLNTALLLGSPRQP